MAKKKLTEKQVTLIARNYVRAMFENQDSFYLDNESILSESEEERINKEIIRVSKLLCPDNIYLNIGDTEVLVNTVSKMSL